MQCLSLTITFKAVLAVLVVNNIKSERERDRTEQRLAREN